MVDKKVIIINDRKGEVHNNTTNVSRGMSGRGKFLPPVSSGSKRLGYTLLGASSFNGFTVFRVFILILFIGSYVRMLYGDTQLTFTGLLNGLSEMKGIPTDWISDLSFKMKDWLSSRLGSGDSLIGKNVIQLLTNLILPLPTILYLLVGILNIIWYITSFFSLIFGGFML